MKNNSIEEILKAFCNVRVELLDDNARLLFDTIMREFDKRDNYKQALYKIKEYITNLHNYRMECEFPNKKEKLYASEKDFVSDILKIINEVLGDNNEKN